MTTNPFIDPFYTTPNTEVQEDHARHLIVHQYVACITVTNQWAIPDDAVAVWLDMPALVDVLIGSVIWNPTYGYFLVTAFDKQAQRLQVIRTNQSQAPGTVVVSNSKFIFTPFQEFYFSGPPI